MSTQECKYHFHKKNAKKLQVFFYILDCVLLKKKKLLDVISIVAKATKFEQECYISNQLFLIQIIKI